MKTECFLFFVCPFIGRQVDCPDKNQLKQKQQNAQTPSPPASPPPLSLSFFRSCFYAWEQSLRGLKTWRINGLDIPDIPQTDVCDLQTFQNRPFRKKTSIFLVLPILQFSVRKYVLRKESIFSYKVKLLIGVLRLWPWLIKPEDQSDVFVAF